MAYDPAAEGAAAATLDNVEAKLAQQGTPEALFALAGLKKMAGHEGRPSASLNADGDIQFTYPDGTVTVGGKRVN